MTQTPDPDVQPVPGLTPDDVPEPDELPATPLEPSVTNPDADGSDVVPA